MAHSSKFVAFVLVLSALWYACTVSRKLPRAIHSTVLTSPDTALLVRRGERLAAATCYHCHIGDDDRLSGGRVRTVPNLMGNIYAANITRHPDKGIGKWSEADLMYFLRTGVKPNGEKANIVMPRFPNIADHDLQAIVRFLQSDKFVVQPSDRDTPGSKLSLIGKLAQVVKPMTYDYPPQPILLPDTINEIKYGKYLVDDLLHCFACHSKDIKRISFKDPSSAKGYMAGGTRMKGIDGEKLVAPGFTREAEEGTEEYTREEFISLLKSGRKPSGRFVRYPMQPYSTLTDREIASIYAYLSSLSRLK